MALVAILITTLINKIMEEKIKIQKDDNNMAVDNLNKINYI